jgi:hypothetical protein
MERRPATCAPRRRETGVFRPHATANRAINPLSCGSNAVARIFSTNWQNSLIFRSARARQRAIQLNAAGGVRPYRALIVSST